VLNITVYDIGLSNQYIFAKRNGEDEALWRKT